MTDSLVAEFKFTIVPEWLLDADVSGNAVLLYVALGRYADSQTHEAFPSRKVLSDRTRMSPASVDRASAELVKVGAITKRQRHNNSIIYTLRVSSPTGPLSSPVTTAIITRDDSYHQIPEPNDTHLTENHLTDIKGDIKKAFDEFWAIYPKKVDRVVALASFKKALKITTLDVILAGATRYRDDPNRDAQYTKNPSTWLRAEAWTNEDAPAPVPTNDWGKPLKATAEGPDPRAWVLALHKMDEHFECRPGEFGHTNNEGKN